MQLNRVAVGLVCKKMKIRRTFPRTPSSPQASATVETPAHYAPTLLLLIGSVCPRW